MTHLLRRRLGAALLAAAMLPVPVAAQTWQGRSLDSGALIHGNAAMSDGRFAISCTAPSPQGRPLIETGDHEALRTEAPYGVAVWFSPDLLDPFGVDPRLPAPRLRLDGVEYPLVPMEYSDFFGAWTGITHIDAPGILELFQAARLEVDPGQGGVVELPVDWLSAALDTALGDCIERWFELGNPLPPRLQAYVATGRAPDQPLPVPVPLADDLQPDGADLPDGLRSATIFELPDVAPQAAFDHIEAQCGGPFELTRPEAVTVTDLDGDGYADYILNYGGVSCADPSNGGFCGAANCAFDVFLSTRLHADPVPFLGIALEPVVDEAGRRGLVVRGSFSLCGDTGTCLPPFFWNGSDFAQ